MYRDELATAAQHFEKAVNFWPFPGCCRFLLNALCEQKQHKKALEFCEKFLNQSPDSPVIIASRGFIKGFVTFFENC